MMFSASSMSRDGVLRRETVVHGVAVVVEVEAALDAAQDELHLHLPVGPDGLAVVGHRLGHAEVEAEARADPLDDARERRSPAGPR